MNALAWLTRRLPRLRMPLLVKELTELAARRRTYVTRVGYAIMVAGLFLVAFRTVTMESQGDLSVLGRGAELLDVVVYLQFMGIYLFLPAMMCGAITQEKERGSLELLFVTDLTPWEILFQKYLSRLVPMFTCLLVCLPMMGVAYSLGGVTPMMLGAGIYLLVLTCLQVGAICLMFSCFFRTTLVAYIAAYLLGVMLTLGPTVLADLAYEMGGPLSMLAAFMSNLFRSAALGDSYFGGGSPLRYLLFPPALYDYIAEQDAGAVLLVLISGPQWLLTGVLLLLSRHFLVKRAFRQSSNLVQMAFQRIDKAMDKANQRAGGVVIGKQVDALPHDHPIAWRETAKRAMGKPQHLLRILLGLELPLVIIITLMIMGVSSDMSFAGREWLYGMTLTMWLLTTLLLTVVGAGAFASERTNQTLEVLLTAPLSGRDIVLQKVTGLRRVMWVMMTPLTTAILFDAWWRSSILTIRTYGGYMPADLYLLGMGSCLLIYPPLLMWLSVWTGLYFTGRSRVILTAVSLVVLWCLVPVTAGIMAGHWFDVIMEDDALKTGVMMVMCVSPLTLLLLMEVGEPSVFTLQIWVFIAWNALFHGTLLWWFRNQCLAHADQFLGRVTEDDVSKNTPIMPPPQIAADAPGNEPLAEPQ